MKYWDSLAWKKRVLLLIELAHQRVTQRELCARVGISEKHCSNVLHGKADLSDDLADKMAQALGRTFHVELS